MCDALNKACFLMCFTCMIILSLGFIIASLPLVWLDGNISLVGTSVGSTKVTLTHIKFDVGSSAVSVEKSYKIKDYCDSGFDSSFACKLYKGSDTLITLTTFGLVCLIAFSITVFVNVCSKMKKGSFRFKLFYVLISLAQLILFVVPFVVYSVVAEDAKDKGLEYGIGWILYLVGLVISGLSTLCALLNMSHIDNFDCCV